LEITSLTCFFFFVLSQTRSPIWQDCPHKARFHANLCV